MYKKAWEKKGMKKKGRRREREETNEKIKIGKKSWSVAIAAVIVSSALIAFMPLAAAVTISNFVITPADNTAGVSSAYTIQVNTTNFTSLNISIPAGFKAKTPSGGEQIAEVDLWWDNPTPHYGYINFTANVTNPSDKVDVC